MNDWFVSLRQKATNLRKKKPLPPETDLTSAEEWQQSIIGGGLIQWLDHHGPAFLSERKVLHKLIRVDPEPGIVFTSNIPGLLAAKEILGIEMNQIVYLHEKEFQRWLRNNPDPEYRWHMHFWSFFREPIQRKFATSAKKTFPLDDGSSYWQNSEGTMWGALAGRGAEHLWKWNGVEPELLQEAFENWIS
jgi:hypothetical protein